MHIIRVASLCVRRHRLHTFEPSVRRQRRRSLEGAGGPLEAGEKTRLRQQRWRNEQQQLQQYGGDGGGDDDRGRQQQQRQPEDRARRKCKFRVLTTTVAKRPTGPRPPSPSVVVDRCYYSEECDRGAADLDLMTEFVSMAAATAWWQPRRRRRWWREIAKTLWLRSRFRSSVVRRTRVIQHIILYVPGKRHYPRTRKSSSSFSLISVFLPCRRRHTPTLPTSYSETRARYVGERAWPSRCFRLPHCIPFSSWFFLYSSHLAFLGMCDEINPPIPKFSSSTVGVGPAHSRGDPRPKRRKVRKLAPHNSNDCEKTVVFSYF